jgi:hypothetical protein
MSTVSLDFLGYICTVIGFYSRERAGVMLRMKIRRCIKKFICSLIRDAELVEISDTVDVHDRGL